LDVSDIKAKNIVFFFYLFRALFGHLMFDPISFQANYKIMAARLHYEIYALTQRLRLTTIRAEHEQAVSCSFLKQKKFTHDFILILSSIHCAYLVMK
jgi:hypothetical protein